MTWDVGHGTWDVGRGCGSVGVTQEKRRLKL